jgi:hypothetical protein
MAARASIPINGVEDDAFTRDPIEMRERGKAELQTFAAMPANTSTLPDDPASSARARERIRPGVGSGWTPC